MPVNPLARQSIEVAIEQLGGSGAALADALKVSPGAVSMWRLGRTVIAERHFEAIVRLAGRDSSGAPRVTFDQLVRENLDVMKARRAA